MMTILAFIYVGTFVLGGLYLIVPILRECKVETQVWYFDENGNQIKENRP